MFQTSQDKEKASVDIPYEVLRDQLTGLPDRQVFIERCREEIKKANKFEKNFAVHLLCVPYAHDLVMEEGLNAGEAYLRNLASQLYGILNENKFCARIGSNLFGVIQRDVSHDGHALYLARRINEKLYLEAKEEVIQTHIGIAVYPHHATECGELIDKAFHALDYAMLNDCCVCVADDE